MAALADVLMVLHFLWVAFMVFGLPLGMWLRSPKLRWAHFLGMTATALIAAANAYCPLTVWEEALRWNADPSFSYGESFLARHLAPLLYPNCDAAVLRWASVTWGALTAALMVLKPPGRPWERTG